MENWSAIVITCYSDALASCVEAEVQCLQKRGVIQSSVPVLTVEDPAEHMGSGAATVNALLVATEYLSAQKNFSVVNADVLDDAHVLILHQGRDCTYSGCAKSLITVPRSWLSGNFKSVAGNEDVTTNLELLLSFTCKLAKGSPPGVWVCSTDMSLVTTQDPVIDWSCVADVVLFCVPSNVEYAMNHGCAKIDEKGYVADIVYCGSSSTISKYTNEDGFVPIVSGIVFISFAVAESLLSLHSISPLESCTYIGMDSGAEPVQVSLYFDVLMSMATGITREEFLIGKFGEVYNMKAGYCEERVKKTAAARALVWKELRKFKMIAGILKHCFHFYWTDRLPAESFLSHFLSCQSSLCHSIFEISNVELCSTSALSFRFLNSVVEVSEKFDISPDVVIVNSNISAANLDVGPKCYISDVNIQDFNLSLKIPAGTVLLSFDLPVDDFGNVLVTFGITDQLTLPQSDSCSTFANKPWQNLYSRLGISENDIWDPQLDPSRKNLLNAKLFTSNYSCASTLFLICETLQEPEVLLRWKSCRRFSIRELKGYFCNSKRLNLRRSLYSLVSTKKLKKILTKNEDTSVLPYFVASVAEGWSDKLFSVLDSILSSEENYIILTRALSSMADLLSIMAGKAGGLRSGPGSNRSWSTAFKYLLDGDVKSGMQELKLTRQGWLSKPRTIMRAARHYERAAQILIQNCLKATKQFMAFTLSSLPDIGSWVLAECPARIDLQGGWSDTPPICYELGGSVVNIAVLIDDQKPILAKARRKERLNIELLFGNKESPTRLLIDKKCDILDFDQPYAQGALLKAALVCAGIVDTDSDSTLQEQLSQCCGSGLDVQVFSDLPQGCGMGTSSILAGAVVSVLWSATGKKFDKFSVIHAVLYIEQLLTTGGGWQDQIGGILGGVNRGFSNGSLPLRVEVNPICLAPEVAGKLNEHLILIYTGKVRLAKNILQNVIRNWYARDSVIVKCFQQLISASLLMEKAILDGDLKQIGLLMDQYWEQKKILAPGCEPARVKLIMSILKPICYGQILVGAGGGGFACVLTKDAHAKRTVEQLLSREQIGVEVTCHTVSLDVSGMVISLESS